MSNICIFSLRVSISMWNIRAVGFGELLVGIQGTSQSMIKMTSASRTAGCVVTVTPRYASCALLIHRSDPTISTTLMGNLSQSASSKGGVLRLRPKYPVIKRGFLADIRVVAISSTSRMRCTVRYYSHIFFKRLLRGTHYRFLVTRSQR